MLTLSPPIIFGKFPLFYTFAAMKQVVLFLYIAIAGLIVVKPVSGQEIVINELVSSNISFPDNFSNSSDWLELFNSGSSAVYLSGMGLSDTPDFETAWKFGNVILAPEDHLLVFASGMNITEVLSYESLIVEGDEWKYILPSQEPPAAWKLPYYEDSSWEIGNSGLGYGDDDDYTILPSGTHAVYLRKTFPLEEIDNIASVLLHMDYDDAFVAYINGWEVARANIGTVGVATPYYAFPDSDHEAVMYDGESPDMFDVSDILPSLQEDKNVLALQLFNISTTSSDLTIIPFLTIGKSNGEPNSVPPILQIPESRYHTDFKLSSEGETVYLFNSEGVILDSVQFPYLPGDLSFGRLEDGANAWVMFAAPTPDTSNGGFYYNGINPDTISFSHQSGLYDASISLQLGNSENIHYSLDGTKPTVSSPLYTQPLNLDENTVVKAAIFESDLLGEVIVKQFLFNATHNLPVIAVTTEPDLLWDTDIGMYVYGDDYENSLPYMGANFWEDWEYPFYFNYFDTEGNMVYEANAGAKIFGAWSRANDQRSFSLFAREEYGTKVFDHKFFNDRPYSNYSSLVLRNSGNDWAYSFLRDAIMTTLMKGSRVDYQAYQPAVTYLNGDYWGIYNIREKISEHYLASLHNVDPDDVDLLELNGEVKHGSNEEYIELRSFIADNSMAIDANYEYVMEQIDEVSFIQYQVAQIFYNNRDWPGNNIRYWKVKNGKWRWIIYDTDFGLGIWNPSGYYDNTLAFATDPYGPGWPNPPWSTLFLRKFLDNDQFERKFINHFADAMNSIFLPSYSVAHVDALAENIQDDMAMHRERWGQSYSGWNSEVNAIKTFLTLRPAVARDFIMEGFNLPAVHDIFTEIDNADWGSIQVNSLLIESPFWNGKYFEGNPITLTAFPKPGYKFDHWSGDVNSTDKSIEIDLTGPKSVTAHFTQGQAIEQPIVINEINYNSPDDPDPSDWVELHNYSDDPIDISDWVLKDNDDAHAFVIPDNTIMLPGSYVVLSQDVLSFSAVYPGVEPVIGDLNFGFSSDGDAVRIYNAVGELMDSLNYLPVEPWPEEANGTGSTLELISPELDNSLAENWEAYSGFGTPGEVNHYVSGVHSNTLDQIIKVFPNPCLNHINITLNSQDLDFSSVRIYDLQGNLQLHTSFPDREHEAGLDLSMLSSGQYVLIATLSDGQLRSTLIQKH